MAASKMLRTSNYSRSLAASEAAISSVIPVNVAVAKDELQGVDVRTKGGAVEFLSASRHPAISELPPPHCRQPLCDLSALSGGKQVRHISSLQCGKGCFVSYSELLGVISLEAPYQRKASALRAARAARAQP